MANSSTLQEAADLAGALNREQACAYLGGLSPSGLYRISAEIGSVRIGRRTVYLRRDLDAYLDRQRKAPRAHRRSGQQAS